MISKKSAGQFMFLLLPLIGFCLSPAIAAKASSTNSPDLSWMAQYVGKSSNDLVSDVRFKSTIEAWLPSQAPMPHTRDTAGAAQDFMGQGQGSIQTSGKFLFVNGCLPHACNVARGWLWVDTDPQHPNIVLALLNPHPGPPKSKLPFTLVVVEKNRTPDSIPESARESLHAWLKTMKADNIVDFQVETLAGKRKADLPACLRIN